MGCHGSWKVKTEIWEQGGSYVPHGCLQHMAEQSWGFKTKLCQVVPHALPLCLALNVKGTAGPALPQWLKRHQELQVTKP